MIRTLLLASTVAVAAPALAQTTPADGNASSQMTAEIPDDSVPTATNDHDPTEDNSGTQQYPTTTGAMAQVNGGVTSSSSGAPATGTSPMGSPEGTDFDGTASAAAGDMREDTAGIATDAMETSAYNSQTGMTPVDRSATASSMRDWNFRGDWGQIGSPQWGAATSMSSNMPTNVDTGMGGPIDVDAEWAGIAPAGDHLTPLEFGTWMLEEHGQTIGQQVQATMRSRSSNLPAVQVLNVTGGAFLQADMNGDGRVSRDELRMFAGS